MKKIITIGNAGGYWGDDPDALHRQVFGGPLDYITMDFLAEITMSILQKQKSRDESSGYAKDFVPMLESVLQKVIENHTTIITNAGGIHPHACALAIEAMAKRLNLKVQIAVVSGDNILSDMNDLRSKGALFENMDTGEDFAKISDQLLAANVYFGAAPVIQALTKKPHIIITGRVTDTGISLAPMVHRFGWQLNDWDKLASGIVAGHILECGSQSTGGNFTDWQKVASFHDIGFPIVEMAEDGSFVVTKHPGTGGYVSVDTVREQLFYEMGDPKCYLTPDVVADFTTIELSQLGPDRVQVKGVKGYEPTPFYKVSMAYADGYKSVGTIAISGPKARRKAEEFAQIFWSRCQGRYRDRETEYFGFNACHRSLSGKDDGNEILLRLGVRSYQKEELYSFGKQVPALILSGPPGVTVTGGVPKPKEVVSYWPALIKKELVTPKVQFLSDGSFSKEEAITTTPIGHFQHEPHAKDIALDVKDHLETLAAYHNKELPTLEAIALARSGDKGDTANIGVLARTEAAFEFLKEYLTAQRVKDLFQELAHGRVLRYEVANMQGFNFLLEQALGGGGTKTLRVDAQGKTFAQALLSLHIPIPSEVLASLEHGGSR